LLEIRVKHIFENRYEYNDIQTHSSGLAAVAVYNTPAKIHKARAELTN
jgi:hypothetical protein